MEGINLKLENNTEENLNISYQVHIQDIGWQDWKKNGEMAGTEGQSLRLEAIKIKLESTDKYSIRYRVHYTRYRMAGLENGWRNSRNRRKILRIEAIEIK